MEDIRDKINGVVAIGDSNSGGILFPVPDVRVEIDAECSRSIVKSYLTCAIWGRSITWVRRGTRCCGSATRSWTWKISDRY